MIERGRTSLMAALLVAVTLIPFGGSVHGGEPACTLGVEPNSGPYDATDFVLTGSGFASATGGTVVVSWEHVLGQDFLEYSVTTDAVGGFTLHESGSAGLPARYSASAEVGGCIASVTFSTTAAPCRSEVSVAVMPTEVRLGEPFAIVGEGWETSVMSASRCQARAVSLWFRT